MECKLSIVTVTRNLIEGGRQESFLACSGDVQSQTRRDIEHVIVDGMSDDGTQDLIDAEIRRREKEPDSIPIKFVSEPDSNLYDAMNKAITLSEGEFTLVLNSDDRLGSAMTAERILLKSEEGGCDFIFGSALIFDEDGSKKQLSTPLPKLILQRMSIFHTATAFRTEMLRELGGYRVDCKIAADYDLVLRMLFEGYTGREIPDTLSFFSLGGMSSDFDARDREIGKIWLDIYREWLPGDVTEAHAFDWAYRERLPISLCFAIWRDSSLPPLIRRAARSSLRKSVKKTLQSLLQFGSRRTQDPGDRI